MADLEKRAIATETEEKENSMKNKIWKKIAVMTAAGTMALGMLGGISAAEELEEMDLVLDWYPNAVHECFYVAMEKGYYEEEGLKLNIQFPANTNDGLSMPAAGTADVGLYYMQDVIMAKAEEHVPVKSIGALVQAPLSVVVSLTESGIKSPADLKGKTLGHGGSALGEAKIKAMLDYEHVDSSEVSTIDVGFDLMSSMTTGQVDATIGCLVNHEIPEMREEGFDVSYFSPTQFGVPNYYELVFVVGEKDLEENPEKYEKFLRATKKGFEDMKADPDEALQILLANQNAENFPLTQSVEEQSSDYLLGVYETEEYPFPCQDKAVWQENIDWLLEQGLISEEISADDLVADVSAD